MLCDEMSAEVSGGKVVHEAAGTGDGTHVVDRQLGERGEAADLSRLDVSEDKVLDEDSKLRHDHPRAVLSRVHAREEEREDLLHRQDEAAAEGAASSHGADESGGDVCQVSGCVKALCCVEVVQIEVEERDFEHPLLRPVLQSSALDELWPKLDRTTLPDKPFHKVAVPARSGPLALLRGVQQLH